jgi:hypothetical protein
MWTAVLSPKQDVADPLLPPFDCLHYSQPLGAAGEQTRDPAYPQQLGRRIVAQHSCELRADHDRHAVEREVTQTGRGAIE